MQNDRQHRPEPPFRDDGIPGSIQVLDRAGAILSVLEHSDDPITLRAIASSAGLNKATAHRILNGLIRLRLVEKGPHPGTYQLGIRGLQLGMRVQRRLHVRTRALPYLQHLNKASGETSFLFVRSGAAAACIERLDGKVIAHQLPLGELLPLHAGAAPRVFLASLSATEFHDCVHTDLERFTAKTLLDPAALLADTLLTRRQGYVLSEEDVTDGMCAVGAPIFDLQGGVVAAVSISGVAPRYAGPQQIEMVRLVRLVARDVSVALGYPPHLPLPWGNNQEP